MLEKICDKTVELEQKVKFIAEALCDQDGKNDGARLFLRDIASDLGEIADELNNITSTQVISFQDELLDQFSSVHSRENKD